MLIERNGQLTQINRIERGDLHGLVDERYKSIPIGYYTRITEFGVDPFVNGFDIDNIDGTVRIFIVAESGAGKTWLIRALCDRLSALGVKFAHANDLGGEIKFSRFPNNKFFPQLKSQLPRVIRKKFDENIARSTGVVPQGISDLRVFSPEFKSRVDGTESFSFRFASLDIPTACAMLSVVAGAFLQKRVIFRVLKILRKYERRGITLNEEIIEQIRSAVLRDLARKVQVKKLNVTSPEDARNKVFDSLGYAHELRLVDGKFPKSMKEMVIGEDGHEYNIAIDWSAVKNNELRDNHGAYQAYISYFINEIFELKKSGVLENDYCIIADEMQHFLSRDSKSPVFKSIEDVFTKGRKWGVSAVVAMQSLAKLDEEIFLQNSTHMFLGRMFGTLKIQTFRKALNQFFEGDAEETNNTIKMWSKLEKHEFLAISKDPDDNGVTDSGIIKIYPPLSMHKTRVN